MASNADHEMRWIAAWDDVYGILGDRRDAPCQLPDCSAVNVQQCLAWLQDSVYDGFLVRVESGWVGHLRGIVVHRWRESDLSLESRAKDG